MWFAGFTLDKESNTVAIICQDLTVVLAFDTRERLIQWQVKIGTHLGDGKFYLLTIPRHPENLRVTLLLPLDMDKKKVIRKTVF